MKKSLLFALLASLSVECSFAQGAIQNVMGRERTSLNGTWNALTDIQNTGKKGWGKINATRNSSTSLRELCYEGDITLEVPGDWNHQDRAFFYYEGIMWYQRYFDYAPQDDKIVLLHFGAVSMHCTVFVNGEEIGTHRGGFTPFQFDVTDKLLPGENYIVLSVDNIRSETTIPAYAFDWWNYGGITRDVDLVYLPKSYIADYKLSLKDNRRDELDIWVKLEGESVANREVVVSIPEAKLKLKLKTDERGEATAQRKLKLKLWSPESPKLYDVALSSELDKVEDKIGFRTIEVSGEDILLNGEPIFLRGINIHEEIAAEQRRSCTQADAEFLVGQAKDLGCNFIRLSHYAHNEYMVREAERQGFLMWEEIPVWQNIKLKDPAVCDYARGMMQEMICRDKNRCGIIMWSISNEVRSYKERNIFFAEFVREVKATDPTRLVTSALNGPQVTEEDGKFYMTHKDPLINELDVVGINKYMGWYQPFPCPAAELNWRIAPGKPVIVSEFGSECVYGNHEGDTSNLNSWSEDYMSQNYRDNIASFNNFPNLRGTAPWILFDFRSPRRPHAQFQRGWNRKGLISPEGGRKEAWHVMREFYESKKQQ
ncbi:MAG: glycoside hydrolase family 2 TIM barrel-domain containing protein [Rikenellaceae bacterium]